MTKERQFTITFHGGFCVCPKTILLTACSAFPWNLDPVVGAMPVLPVIHATNHDAALNICKTGFATLATLDAGFYGQGTPLFSSKKRKMTGHYDS